MERERVMPYRPFIHYNSWYELNINRNNDSDPAGGKSVRINRLPVLPNFARSRAGNVEEDRGGSGVCLIELHGDRSALREREAVDLNGLFCRFRGGAGDAEAGVIGDSAEVRVDL